MVFTEGIYGSLFAERCFECAGLNYPDWCGARVARGIAAIETTEGQKKACGREKKFFDALTDFGFLFRGRILGWCGFGASGDIL